jgi:hypothetical protein
MCMAVGWVPNGSTCAGPAFAEVWRGGRWSSVHVPNPAAVCTGLEGVACVDTSWCLAVGLQEAGHGGVVLAEIWNGHDWRVTQPVTPAGTIGEVLSGVSCVSRTACMAVGDSSNGVDETLAEFWNGSRWRMLAPLSDESWFGSVSCSSAEQCAAVGVSGINPPDESALAAHWDGARWASRSTAQTLADGDEAGEFAGVSCPAQDFCMAVGYGSGSIVETWDGTGWRPIPSPPGQQFDAVACGSAVSCIAGTGTKIYLWRSGRWTLAAA